MILINGANLLQSFFAVTGYLISVQFMDLREKNKFDIAYFWKAIIYRYIRYVKILSLRVNLYRLVLAQRDEQQRLQMLMNSARTHIN